MKTLIISSVTVILFLLSCTKEAQRGEDYSAFYGEYHNAANDTATVSSTETGMLKIRFAYKNPVALRCTFDSLHMNSDLSFTCNEYTVREITGNTRAETVVGSGKFGENTLEFNITLSGAANLKFNGVKKQ